jgi:hypothetical protein
MGLVDLQVEELAIMVCTYANKIKFIKFTQI